MPKIIENLEDKIIKKSLSLFRKNSYKEVGMRTIAEEVGIAVGTLYNYYPNKWKLYIEVLEESWQETYQRLKKNCKNVKGDYLKGFLQIFYFEMKDKKGIVRELFRYIMNDLELNEEEQKEKLDRIRFPDTVINQIHKLFIINLEKEFAVDFAIDDLNLNRLFTMLQTYIPILQRNYKNDQENITYLYDLTNSYLKEKIIKQKKAESLK